MDPVENIPLDLTIVGDPRQAIFSFKGADPSFLLDFPKRYPNAIVVQLGENFRSTIYGINIPDFRKSYNPRTGSSPHPEMIAKREQVSPDCPDLSLVRILGPRRC